MNEQNYRTVLRKIAEERSVSRMELISITPDVSREEIDDILSVLDAKGLILIRGAGSDEIITIREKALAVA